MDHADREKYCHTKVFTTAGNTDLAAEIEPGRPGKDLRQHFMRSTGHRPTFCMVIADHTFSFCANYSPFDNLRYRADCITAKIHGSHM